MTQVEAKRMLLLTANPEQAITAMINLFLHNDWSGHSDAEIRRDAEVLRGAAWAADLLDNQALKAAATDAWWQVVNP